MPNDYNQLLRNRPMDLFRQYPVSPPSALQGQTMTAARPVFTDRTGWLLDDNLGTTISTRTVTAGGIQWIDLKNDPNLDKVGSLTFTSHPTPHKDAVPVHFLPWNSMSLIEMTLPPVGRDLDDIDGNPRLFFTAAIGGCSVFVDGPPTTPRVVHAGIDGKFKAGVDSGSFWRDCMNLAARQSGHRVGLNLGELNRNMYNDTSTAAGYRQIETWMADAHRDTLRVQESTPWVCVFGIRFGRLWSFYAQRNINLRVLRLVKRKDTEKQTHRNGLTGKVTHTTYTQKGTGLTVFTDVQKRKWLSDTTLFGTQEIMNRAVQIVPIFPKGDGRVQIAMPDITAGM